MVIQFTFATARSVVLVTLMPKFINATSGFEYSLAVKPSGHEQLAMFLLSKGADASKADAIGTTPLHAAVQTGKLELAKALLAHDANPNARLTKAPPPLRGDFVTYTNYVGATPFWLAAAARISNVNIMRALTAPGSQVVYYPEAVEAGNVPAETKRTMALVVRTTSAGVPVAGRVDGAEMAIASPNSRPLARHLRKSVRASSRSPWSKAIFPRTADERAIIPVSPNACPIVSISSRQGVIVAKSPRAIPASWISAAAMSRLSSSSLATARLSSTWER